MSLNSRRPFYSLFRTSSKGQQWLLSGLQLAEHDMRLGLGGYLSACQHPRHQYHRQFESQRLVEFHPSGLRCHIALERVSFNV